MLRGVLIGAAAAVAVMASTAAFAQKAESGSAGEAKAMLEKAVAAVTADKAKALATFNKGEGGFRDRDLYPFCFNIADGIIVAGAGPAVGKDIRTLKDASDKVFGLDVYKAAQDGKITDVSYMFPKAGETTPSAKTSYVTKVGDLGCGVGYYK